MQGFFFCLIPPEKGQRASADSQLLCSLQSNKKVAGSETGEQGKTEREEESETGESNSQRTKMGCIFTLPFISVEAHSEQKVVNADESSQPRRVASSLWKAEHAGGFK